MTTAAATAAVRFGLDSNILVYAVDSREPERQAQAQALVERAARTGRCLLSTQNVGEFYAAVTRKRLAGPELAGRKAVELTVMFPITAPDATDVRAAVAAAVAGRLSYWDALLLATLARAGCTVVLSEDMQDGAGLAGAVVRNPFAGETLPDEVAALLG